MKQAILELIDKKMLRVHPGFTKPILQELRSEIEKMEEWIPVTERSPEEDVFCLMRFVLEDLQEDVRYQVASRSKSNMKYHSYVYIDQFSSYIPFSYIPTHWQPLPLPPNN